jgi:hypothetical protein
MAAVRKRGYPAGGIALIEERVFVELGVSDLEPALNAPEVSHQLQQGLWGSSQAC